MVRRRVAVKQAGAETAPCADHITAGGSRAVLPPFKGMQWANFVHITATFFSD
jgi:hypothetical protein